MPLALGTRVGVYEVVALLGAGGVARSTAPVVLNWFEELRRRVPVP